MYYHVKHENTIWIKQKKQKTKDFIVCEIDNSADFHFIFWVRVDKHWGIRLWVIGKGKGKCVKVIGL